MAKENTKDNLEEETKVEVKQPEPSYFFPDYGVTVEAPSLEEATIKVKKLFNK